jgi:hypothetical protein
MNKPKLQILPTVSLITFIAGLVIIINSAGFGVNAASTFLGGGPTSPEGWAMLVQGYTNSFTIIGAVLFFLGGLGCLISIIFLEMQKE